jgi:hypothetical protein
MSSFQKRELPLQSIGDSILSGRRSRLAFRGSLEIGRGKQTIADPSAPMIAKISAPLLSNKWHLGFFSFSFFFFFF